jgi:transmembrane sensor
MTEQNTKYWELFTKQKNGTVKSEEQIALLKWKESNPEEFNKFESIFRATLSDRQIPVFDPNENWDELRTMIKANTENTANKIIQIFPWIARIAAAVILVFGFAYLFNNYSDKTSDTLIMQTMVQTGNTDKKEVILPDGTAVWLNRNSELLYPEQFDEPTRTIYLKGEAFFEVVPNKDKPFIIYSGSTKTTVLGTSFNLRAYGKEDEVKLTVVTGKVAFTLNDEKEGVIVTPGNMAVMANENKVFSSGVNTDLNFLSWKTNQLTFNENRLEDLIIQLERHFDVRIYIENDATRLCTFTGDFNNTKLENALKIITKATGTSFAFNDGQYSIQGKGCN